GRGFAYLVRRWWTGAPKKEHVAYLTSIADLAAKLRASGMNIDDVRQLETILRSPAIASSEAAGEVVQPLVDKSDPAEFQSNPALKARAAASYSVAEARLDQALMDLQLLISDGEWEIVEKAQKYWQGYRRALEDSALRQYQGGTHAPLAMTLAGLAET